MQRYNIALLPKNKSDEFIHLSQKLDNETSDYTLGRNSLPHVTVAQFETDESTLQEIILATDFSPIIEILFDRAECYKDEKRLNYFWISLMPQYQKNLHDLHSTIIHLLAAHETPCLNRSLEQYDPHLTLLHSTRVLAELDEIKTPIMEDFYLTLGKSDAIGQYLEPIAPNNR